MSSLNVPTALPWWRSKIIVGAAVSILTKLLVASGLVGDLAPADSEEITNLILLVIGGVGDLVAIGSRVAQKHAPTITATKPPAGVLSMFALALLTPMLLAGCNLSSTLPPPSSVSGASHSVLDEQTGVLVTDAYTAASLAASLAIKTGVVSKPATVRKIGELDNRAYTAVLAVRSAYQAGNASSYNSAIADARAAVNGMIAAIKGDTP